MAGSVKHASANDAWTAVQRGDGQLVDVREPGEFSTVRTPNTLNFPLSSLEDRVSEIPAGAPVYLLCAVGARALAAAAILAENGRSAIVVDGGMIEWRRRGLPAEHGTRRVWDMDRQVRLVAGTLVLTGVMLGWLVHPKFYILAGFVGAGLSFSGLTGFCGMARVLARLPWNRK